MIADATYWVDQVDIVRGILGRDLTREEIAALVKGELTIVGRFDGKVVYEKRPHE
jgi:hypothetical protein